MIEAVVFHVLYVESNLDLLQRILPALTAQEYSITVVHSADEALDEIKKNPYDLVIINQNLSDTTGTSCMQLLLLEQPELAVFVLLEETQLNFIPQILAVELSSYVLLDREHIYLAQLSPILTNLLGRQRLVRRLRQTEKSLESKTEYMKAVFDHAPVEIYLKGTDRAYQWVNKQWQLHYNHTNDSAIGLKSHDIIPPKTANISKSNDEKVLETGLPTEESQIVETSIGLRSLRTLRFPVKNSADEITGIGVIALDDTEKRQSEAVLKSVFEDAPIGIVLHAPDGSTRVRVNAAFCNFVGYSRAELLQNSYEELTYHKDLEESLRLRRDLYAGKKNIISFEKRYTHKKGHIIWGSVSSYVIRGDANEPLYFVSYIQDITNRKSSEKTLRLLGQAVEAATDALVIVDAQDKSMPIISINSAFTQMTGYSESECLGRNCIFLQGEDEQLEIVEEVQHAYKNGQTAHVVFRNYKKSGEMFWNDIQMAPIRSNSGEITHFVASMRDISEERRSREKLEAYWQRLSLATEGIGIGVWDWDISKDHLLWDKLNCELYGQTLSSFNENFEGWTKNVHPDDIEKAQSDLALAIAGDKELDTQFRIIRPDGEIRTLKGRAFVSRDERGNAIRVVGINWDITENIAMEEQIRHSQKMDAVGQLTGGIAHDFNNILGIVLGNLELIEDRTADSPEIRKLLNPALHGLERGANITAKLLSFSKQKTTGSVSTQINDVLRNMQDLLSTSLTVSINIIHSLSQDLWRVDIDPGDLEDSILNLCLNARDAMPDGGTLSIKTSNLAANQIPPNSASADNTKDYVLISVSDQGVGMSNEVKEKLFDPFFTTKSPGKGTGLGLSMVFGFMQRSDGFITLESKLGTGTTLNLYLPKGYDNKKSASQNAIENIGLPGGTEKILIVDDEEDLADLAAIHLEELGYHTHKAATGVQALKILKHTPDIDLLFSDVVMPGDFDGYQLSQEASKIRPGLKILLTSGFTREKEISSIGDTTLVTKLTKELLGKPYNRREIAAAVRRTLDESY